MDNSVTLRLLDDLQKMSELYLEQIKSKEDKAPRHKSYETKDLYAALAKAQAEMPMASLNAANPYFKTRYTDLAEIVRSSRPSLTKYGLSVTQQLITNDDGSNVLVTTLAHSTGQYVESCLRILPPKSDIQSLGSYISYLRRYSLASLICLASSDEDDDGEEVMADQRQLISKGPARNAPVAQQNKNQAYEPITKEQLEQLEDELTDCPDLAEEVLEKMQLQSLADMRKSHFKGAIDRIRQIKLDRATVK